MQKIKLSEKIILFLLVGFGILIPLQNGDANAQQNADPTLNPYNTVQYQRLTLQKLVSDPELGDFSKPNELELSPLSTVESNIARNLHSHWAWPEHTLDMIDGYSPFLFRTKKSQQLNEVKVLLAVNSKGRVSGFEIIGDVDKGLRERLDHVIRKIPDCKPVPGYAVYGSEQFELTIKK